MIYKIIEQIAQEPSTNKKEEILREHKDNETLKLVCYLAESPRIKFYLKQIPEPLKVNYKTDFYYNLQALDLIYTREWTGDMAKHHLSKILGSSSEQEREIIKRIVLKDLRMNCGTKIMNKVWPNLIETTPYQGAKPFSRTLVEKLLDKGKVVAQLKMDGCYSNAIIYKGSVEFVSRQGEIQHIPSLGFEKLPDGVLNGELTLKGYSNRAKANGIIRSIIDIEGKSEEWGKVETEKKKKAFEKKNNISYQEALTLIEYTAWDYLTLEEYYDKKSNRPYFRRLGKLYDLGIPVVEERILNSFEDIMGYYSEVVGKGLEGIIVKGYGSEWKDGKPNWSIKIKEEIHLDLEIVGYNLGTGKNEGFVSSVICRSSCGKLRTVPTGMTEEQMKDFTENQEEYLGKILEVKCSGLSQDKDGNYSTLHPVLIEVRNDKDVADNLEEILNIVNNG